MLWSLALFLSGAHAQCAFGTPCWWEEQYPWQTPGPSGSSWCDIAANEPVGWPTNEECNGAGKCVVHNPFQQPVADSGDFTWGICQCADTLTPGNFVYNDTDWIFQTFFGDQCNEFSFELYGTITYLIRVAEWTETDPTLQGTTGIACRLGDTGYGQTFDPNDVSHLTGTDHLVIPDLTPIISTVINYPEGFPGTGLSDGGYYRNYKGKVVPWYRSSIERQHCKICSNSHTCSIDGTLYGDVDGIGGYLMVSFATNFNTYYNQTCEKTYGIMPEDQAGAENQPNCDANYDGGNQAAYYWLYSTVGGEDEAEDHKAQATSLAAQSTSTMVFNCSNAPAMTTPCTATEPVFGNGWAGTVQITRTDNTGKSVTGVASDVLQVPTKSPTRHPSVMPTPAPTIDDSCFYYGYTHQIEDLKFAGIAEDKTRGCRWGLDTNWPGGDEPDMCESPYVICLPQENTPSGFPLPSAFATNKAAVDPYLATDAEYTIAQCKKECAYDQRCQGFEFLPTGDNAGEWTGTCKLIDDIPVVTTSDGGVSADPAIVTEADLLSADYSTLGGAVCYHKEYDCNPYFAADDLNQVMLDCYCPNNRKGFYTKNVVRTVPATRYCGNDDAVTERIMTAQANRMFHLCENWCLFNVQNPRTESWYHDPWEECWREQYAGVGKHRSYCYRVIRDPFTIEQYFIDQRSQKMCNSSTEMWGNNPNTPSPVTTGVTTTSWTLANEGDSCDDVCDDMGLVCNQADIETIINGVDPAIAQSAFLDGGFQCSSTFTDAPEESKGWALPAVTTGEDGYCILRHPDANTADLMAGCNVAIGTGYMRLCACGTV